MFKIIENKLLEEFRDKDFFTREELFCFFKSFEPDLKEGTLGWRIYNLKNKNLIKSLKRGVYVISDTSAFSPNISPELLKIFKKIQQKYNEVKYCIWNTAWLNEFSVHQSGKSIVVIEIEKEFVESLYYHLKDNFSYDVYLNPDENEIDFYIAESNYPIVIKKLVTRSPIDKMKIEKLEIPIPMLEKILVDIFSDEKLFYFYRGQELNNIYENALKSYTINFTKLFSYAKRRDKEKEIREFMVTNMNHLVKDFIND